MLCRADAIPPSIDADLTGLDINDSVHISQVPLPEGVWPTVDRDFTIATIGAPSAVKAEIAEEQAAEAEAEEAEAEAAEAEAEEAAETVEGAQEGEEQKEE